MQIYERNPWKEFSKFLAFIIGGLIVLLLMSGCVSIGPMTETFGTTGKWTCPQNSEVFEDFSLDCPSGGAIQIYDPEWIETHENLRPQTPYAVGPDSIVTDTTTIEGDIGPQIMYGPNGEIMPYPSEGPILTAPVN